MGKDAAFRKIGLRQDPILPDGENGNRRTCRNGQDLGLVREVAGNVKMIAGRGCDLLGDIDGNRDDMGGVKPSRAIGIGCRVEPHRHKGEQRHEDEHQGRMAGVGFGLHWLRLSPRL